jgi:hypothetical protein
MTFVEGGQALSAAQWDVIERDLHVPELWAFVTGKTYGDAMRRWPRCVRFSETSGGCLSH